MIFQNDDDLYRSRRKPWGTILLSAFCFALALALVFGIRARLKRGEERRASGDVAEAVFPDAPAPDEPSATPVNPANPATTVTPATSVASAPAATPATRPATPARPASASGASSAVPASGLLAERASLREKLAKAAPAERPAIEAMLGDVNVRLATTPVPSPHKVLHEVVSGDSLAKLANRYVCPVTLIQKINGLKDNNIRIGQKLLVLDHPEFAIEISRSHNTLLLTLYGEFFKRYPVCTGENGKTPVGTFVITEKETDPTWFPAGKAPIGPGQPGNILGTRWMRLEATGNTPRVSGIGIHGTVDDASIGTSASDGCIRMHNADVEEIFRMIPLNPHVPVTIVD